MNQLGSVQSKFLPLGLDFLGKQQILFCSRQMRELCKRTKMKREHKGELTDYSFQMMCLRTILDA